MIMRFVKAALAAGFVAGILVSVLQNFTTTPLILEAEKYEVASIGSYQVASLFRPAVTSDAMVIPVHNEMAHGAEGEEWAPQDGVERTLFTSVAMIATTFGFALALLAVMVLTNSRIDPRSGLMWGAAAFVATGLAPALGLSPELPGSAAAELASRQLWWIGTMVATAAGLLLMLRVSTPFSIAAGLALLVLPHVIGAPHPHEFSSAVPSELSGHFASASLVVHAVAWAVTGVVAGFVWVRTGEEDETAAA